MTIDRKQHLRELFNREAIRATREHLRLHNGLLIIDSAHEQSIYAGVIPELDPLVSPNRAKEAQFIEKLSFGAVHSHCNKNFGFNYIVMAAHVTVTNAMYGLSHDQEVLFVLDHEIGHLVVEGGFYTGSNFMREACADSYALLRAGQRWGDITPFVRANQFKRAFDLAFKGRMSHYTLPATTALAALVPTLDLTNMKPLEVAELAQRLMLKNCPDGRELTAATAAFRPVIAAFSNNDDNLDIATQTLLQLLEKNQLPALAQSAARLVLQEFLKPDTLVHAKPVALHDSTRARITAWLAQAVITSPILRK